MNLVILVGNLTRDPEAKEVGGTALSNFSVAVSRKYKDKKTGNTAEETLYMDCEVWGSSAGFVNQYCKKGDKVMVRGQLKNDSWEKEGVKHQRTRVRVENIDKLTPGTGGKKETAGVGASNGGSDDNGENIPF